MEEEEREGWSSTKSHSSLAAEREEGGCAMLVAKEAAGIECTEEEELEIRPPRTHDSCRRTAMYPVGCPVWFNVRHSLPCSRNLTAETGVVKTAAFDECMRTIVYEIERSHSAVRGIDGPAENCHGERTIVEEEIAFAVRCPVLVRMKDNEDGDTTEIGGEIINVTPAVRGRRGEKGMFCYSVLITTDEGGVLMEQDVVPERIRYRYSLEALQYSIREVTSSSSHRGKRKAFGIRSNGGQHEPIRKIYGVNGNDCVKEECEEEAKKEEEMSCLNCNKTFKSKLGLKYHLGEFSLTNVRLCWLIRRLLSP
jgi:hypothetical protein